MKERDNIISNVLKANLLLSDYALATDLEEKNTILGILDRYFYELQETRVSVMFRKLCETKEDLYVEILMDLIAELQEELNICQVA